MERTLENQQKQEHSPAITDPEIKKALVEAAGSAAEGALECGREATAELAILLGDFASRWLSDAEKANVVLVLQSDEAENNKSSAQ